MDRWALRAGPAPRSPLSPDPGTHFSAEGELAEKRGNGPPDEFRWDPGARPETNFTGDTGSGEGGLWTATPGYDWQQHPKGTALSHVTEPLAENTTVIGAGALRIWTPLSSGSLRDWRRAELRKSTEHLRGGTVGGGRLLLEAGES